ncbi:hypothetical protein Pmar_PMAR006675 [Perkinsus marinus ATCC 50983]|uniref:Reverse transcriptase domain-containing protein n=1 Tax=Perkinsus marinus (strain ATCC 50983 / TXsc) TaxID=423536 RepID=C5LLY1_PERM5|nr:hypothetical protein Pmar_PMAR006675 [Perkinsus marinus ATCC 50983]EER02353.1 hypothetical protein Pmar_PMAR006675 [Perkinsus marinus ATCC 50983]|eukprot:XP_002769635.1 hypothetical protein Pmar_PMAR006675 [Perkinsus marinus ATCC 50983]
MMKPRKARVATACGTSEPFVVTRSVLQGSILACLLFNLSMEICNTSLAIGTPSLSPKIVLPDGIIKIINRLLFADDQTILVHGRNLPIRVTEMNNSLNSAAMWAERSMNQYAPEKSFVVPLGNRLRETANSQFILRDSEVEIVFNFSSLGVNILSSKRVLWAPLHRKAKATAAVSAALHVYRAMAPVFVVRLVVTVGWSALLYGHDLAFPKPSALDTCCNNLLKIGLGSPTWTPTAFLYLALHVP